MYINVFHTLGGLQSPCCCYTYECGSKHFIPKTNRDTCNKNLIMKAICCTILSILHLYGKGFYTICSSCE